MACMRVNISLHVETQQAHAQHCHINWLQWLFHHEHQTNVQGFEALTMRHCDSNVARHHVTNTKD